MGSGLRPTDDDWRRCIPAGHPLRFTMGLAGDHFRNGFLQLDPLHLVRSVEPKSQSPRFVLGQHFGLGHGTGYAVTDGTAVCVRWTDQPVLLVLFGELVFERGRP